MIPDFICLSGWSLVRRIVVRTTYRRPLNRNSTITRNRMNDFKRPKSFATASHSTGKDTEVMEIVNREASNIESTDSEPTLVPGFKFPLQSRLDVERLEIAIQNSKDVRKKYVQFLVQRKPKNMVVEKFITTIFSDDALISYNLNGSNTPGRPKRPMKSYSVFYDCFIGLLLEVGRLKKRLTELRAMHKSPQTSTINEIRTIHQKLRTIDVKYYQQRCIHPAKPLKISGFPMPLQCEEDIERLELMVNRNPKLRTQYVEFLRCKKAFSVDISDCFGKFFTGEAMVNFSWKTTNSNRSNRKERKIMEQYQIFTSCMLEAWQEHGIDAVKLDSEMRRIIAILSKRRYVANNRAQ
uniref:DUF4806 domain-containing protein n=1 Tax=Anopheles culicifacies TaxID=139723 RepID=A0A182MW89_9DIPT